MSAREGGRQVAGDGGPGIRTTRQGLPLYANPLRQLTSASTWRATWYLLAYLVVGSVLFGVVLAAGITTLALAITLLGLPLLVVTAAVVRGCANAERWRLHPVIPARLTGGYHDAAVPGMLAKIRAAWTDPAIWRNLAYLGGLFPFLWALDLAVLMVWLSFIGLITAPAWYWAPKDTYPGGSHHGLQFGYFPHGPHGMGAVGVYVDTLPKAIGTAVVFLLLSLMFQYVVVLTARMHARVAYSLLGAPADPLAEARSVLDQPGPLGPLRTTARNGNSGQSAAIT